MDCEGEEFGVLEGKWGGNWSWSTTGLRGIGIFRGMELG